jgi:hypothetical protein
MFDKRVRIVPGKGMSRKCNDQIRSLGGVFGTVIGVFLTTNMYRIALDKGIVLHGSAPLSKDRHEILVPLANLRLVE